jgi:predicted ABC-type ATPase
MRTARAKGFDVVLVYIGTEDVEINLARIAKRVQGGGHDVPEVDVRRRFRVNEQPATIIGVMPKGFRFPNKDELWMPLVPTPERCCSAWARRLAARSPLWRPMAFPCTSIRSS